MNCLDLIIISGSANIYKLEQVEENKKMTFIKILQESEEFGFSEIESIKILDDSIKRIILISNNDTEVCFFKLENKFGSNKSKIKKEKKQNKKVKENKTKNDLKNRENENLKNEIPIQKTYVSFDPEIFLIDNPTKLYETIDSVKEKIDKDFNIFDKYSEVINNFSKQKKLGELIRENNNLASLSIEDINTLIDNKFPNYSDDSKIEIKMSILINKTLSQIEKCNKDIQNDLEEIKVKLYSTNNIKNKNLMNMSIEEEIRKDEFKRHIIEKINKEGKLNSLLQEKKTNEEIINKNKIKIKKDENYLLDTFYCIKCHIRPRNVISSNCHHLMFCDECIEKAKVCPRCGIDIVKFDKIFRS